MMKILLGDKLGSKLFKLNGETVIRVNGVSILEQDKEEANSIFNKYKINISYKDKNIDYSSHIDNLNMDVSIIVDNMLEYFEKKGSFEGFNNDIASKGTKSFKYNQIKNVEAYDKFSSLIDKLYSSQTFEELESLVNDKDYSFSINKEKFKLIEKDFKKSKDLIK